MAIEDRVIELKILLKRGFPDVQNTEDQAPYRSQKADGVENLV